MGREPGYDRVLYVRVARRDGRDRALLWHQGDELFGAPEVSDAGSIAAWVKDWVEREERHAAEEGRTARLGLDVSGAASYRDDLVRAVAPLIRARRLAIVDDGAVEKVADEDDDGDVSFAAPIDATPKGLDPSPTATAPISGGPHARPPMPGEAYEVLPGRPRLDPAHQPGRSVDIALRRKGFKSTLVGDEHDPQNVRPETRLGAGRRYEVEVQIGAPLPATLFTEPPPPIDPLLPPSADGHRLEVAIFGLDFTLASRAVRELWLPRTGASKTVGFTVRAPDRPGRARLRVVISHADHALQSFVVTAEVAHTEERAPGRAVIAALEHAATERFANLAQLRPRSATAVINDDPAGGHSITLKRGEQTGTFGFSDSKIRLAAGALRDRLEAAAHAPVFDEPRPRIDTDAYKARLAAYEVELRALATLGANLRLALFDQADEGGRALLRELATSADQQLQLIHVARSLVLPWAGLYDGWIPDDLDTSKLAVCHGRAADGAPCGHTPDDELVCVRRFWGLRHDLELMLGQARPRDTITGFRVPSDRPPLRVLHGQSMQDATYMPDAYVSLMYQPGVPVWDYDVYTLFEAERRPAILVVLGHFATAAPVPGAVVHSIDLVPRPLTNVGVSKQTLSLGDWRFPHSIVLLMACSSAVAAADALTGMIDAFGSAGAAAIIGTESTVFPRLSARAATSLYRYLVDGAGKLAAALRALRWELAGDATPMAFTFTAYGNADLAREDAP